MGALALLYMIAIMCAMSWLRAAVGSLGWYSWGWAA